MDENEYAEFPRILKEIESNIKKQNRKKRGEKKKKQFCERDKIVSKLRSQGKRIRGKSLEQKKKERENKKKVRKINNAVIEKYEPELVANMYKYLFSCKEIYYSENRKKQMIISNIYNFYRNMFIEGRIYRCELISNLLKHFLDFYYDFVVKFYNAYYGKSLQKNNKADNQKLMYFLKTRIDKINPLDYSLGKIKTEETKKILFKEHKRLNRIIKVVMYKKIYTYQMIYDLRRVCRKKPKKVVPIRFCIEFYQADRQQGILNQKNQPLPKYLKYEDKVNTSQKYIKVFKYVTGQYYEGTYENEEEERKVFAGQYSAFVKPCGTNKKILRDKDRNRYEIRKNRNINDSDFKKILKMKSWEELVKYFGTDNNGNLRFKEYLFESAESLKKKKEEKLKNKTGLKSNDSVNSVVECEKEEDKSEDNENVTIKKESMLESSFNIYDERYYRELYREYEEDFDDYDSSDFD